MSVDDDLGRHLHERAGILSEIDLGSRDISVDNDGRDDVNLRVWVEIATRNDPTFAGDI